MLTEVAPVKCQLGLAAGNFLSEIALPAAFLRRCLRSLTECIGAVGNDGGNDGRNDSRHNHAVTPIGESVVASVGFQLYSARVATSPTLHATLTNLD